MKMTESIRETPSSISVRQPFEMLNVQEFSKKVGIGRTKLFEMKASGVLVRGRHYFQNGRKVVFPWGPEYLERLLSECCGRDERISGNVVTKAPLKSDVKEIRKNRKTAMDTNYCLSD